MPCPDMHPYLRPLKKQWTGLADPVKAAGMKAYLLDQFDFLGIPAPERRRTAKTFYQANPISNYTKLENIVKECFSLRQREYHYFAIELFAHHKHLWTPASGELLEFGLTTHSWWDSVDHIGSDWLSDFFLLFPACIKPLTEKWNRSDNIWLQRSSLLFQKKYKTATDTKLLKKYILHLADAEDFFIRKAIGWALREYGKTDPAFVIRFVKEHSLSPLSKKEALKRIHQ
ncbi:MAG: DNA alkylation repair protein [Bacteroidota bacterium]|nr:DNA alkylation repair protein [Bacteroidota bacterium]